jgi:hypothetical protein
MTIDASAASTGVLVEEHWSWSRDDGAGTKEGPVSWQGIPQRRHGRSRSSFRKAFHTAAVAVHARAGW